MMQYFQAYQDDEINNYNDESNILVWSTQALFLLKYCYDPRPARGVQAIVLGWEYT